MSWGLFFIFSVIIILLGILGALWFVSRRDKKDFNEIPNVEELVKPMKINERRVVKNGRKEKLGLREAQARDSESEGGTIEHENGTFNRVGEGLQALDYEQNKRNTRKPKLSLKRTRRD